MLRSFACASGFVGYAESSLICRLRFVLPAATQGGMGDVDKRCSSFFRIAILKSPLTETLQAFIERSRIELKRLSPVYTGEVTHDTKSAMGWHWPVCLVAARL
jgi:hypothetical protein